MANGKTWMPTAAGILDIVAGCLGLFAALLFVFLAAAGPIIPDVPAYISSIFGVLAFPLAIVGILAIVGGIYALKRKIWGLALAGSIAAFLSSWILGLVAIIFTALSKNEFA